MATVTIEIPDDLKARCAQYLDDATISATLTRVLGQMVEQESTERHAAAIERLLARRKQTPPATPADMIAAREAGRP
jgi:predicted transcriptional regulator